MDARSQEKRQRLESALEHGIVMIHLDARRPGVVVPARLRTDFQLRLNLSLRFDPPDLTVGEWGVRETLSFAGQRFKVAVPWEAIYAVTGNSPNGAAWMFPEDMPRELIEAAAKRFGLTGKEMDQLRAEASEASAPVRAEPAEAKPEVEEEGFEPAPAAAGGSRSLRRVTPSSRRFEPRVVEPVEPAPAPVPEEPPVAPPDGLPGRRVGHLRVIK